MSPNTSPIPRQGNQAPTTAANHANLTSVADLVRAASGDHELAERVAEDARRNAITHFLFGIRSSRGVSQAEMAAKLGCSQSRVSKLENGEDDELRLGDLRSYLRCLDHDLMLVICPRQWTLAERIKFFACNIRSCLKRMVGLAEKDATIRDGVSHFHVEAFHNLVKIVLDSARNVPQDPEPVPPIIQADDGEDDCDADASSEKISPRRLAAGRKSSPHAAGV
jgi:transcriptional regulator with XRE-family HTH domain